MGLMEDITQAVARMQDDDNMKGGRVAAKKSASKRKSASKPKASKHTKSKRASKKHVKVASPHKKHSKATVKKPSASKRGASSYNMFVKKEMPAFLSKHPKAKPTEAMSAIAKKWRSAK